MCYGYTAKWYGRSGFAVGCLPAPLRSGPAQKPAGLPSSPPNARGSVPLSALYPRSTWGGFEVPFGRSLPTGRDRPQVHFPESATEKPGRHVQCCSGGHSAALRDRLQIEYRRTQRKKTGDRAAPHEERRDRHFAALRDWPRNHVRSQGCNLDVISRSAGHSQQVVTGFKSTIGEHHGKIKAACHVSFRPALPKSTGAPMRQPFHFGQTSNKEAPDTPLRYVTGFNII